MNTLTEEYGHITREAIQARAMMAFEDMRAIAEANGWLSDDDIEAEISASRRERKP